MSPEVKEGPPAVTLSWTSTTGRRQRKEQVRQRSQPVLKGRMEVRRLQTQRGQGGSDSALGQWGDRVEQNRGFTGHPSRGVWALICVTLAAKWRVVSEDWLGNSGADQQEGTVA